MDIQKVSSESLDGLAVKITELEAKGYKRDGNITSKDGKREAYNDGRFAEAYKSTGPSYDYFTTYTQLMIKE